MPSSRATVATVRPVLITSFTASSLYSGVNPRRVRPMMNILSYEVSTERGQGQRQLLATAAAGVVLASVVIGSLIMASTRASPTASGKKVGGSIVVIGTGGLSWSD